jgi:hypothetical protein
MQSYGRGPIRKSRHGIIATFEADRGLRTRGRKDTKRKEATVRREQQTRYIAPLASCAGGY